MSKLHPRVVLLILTVACCPLFMGCSSGPTDDGAERLFDLLLRLLSAVGLGG